MTPPTPSASATRAGGRVRSGLARGHPLVFAAPCVARLTDTGRVMSGGSAHPVPIDAAFQAISRMDAAALVALCDPQVTFESRITAVEAARYEGHEGIRQYIANLADAFEFIQVDT